MTSTLPHCALVSPYFPDPSVGRANAAASKIDAWSAYASQSLSATPGSGPSSPAPMVGDLYLGHLQDFQERQKNQHDVTSTGNSNFFLRNADNATTYNGKELPTCFAKSLRDNANVDDGENAAKLQQILTSLKIRCHTDVYKNPPSPNLSTVGEPPRPAHEMIHSYARMSSPLSSATQPLSLCAYNRQVTDATRSLYGTPRTTHRPTQMQRQHATGNAPFLAGGQIYGHSNDISDDYSPGLLSPHMVCNLENIISSPVPRLEQRGYEQPTERHMGTPSCQLDGTPDAYAWFLSQNTPDTALQMSGAIKPEQVSYSGRPSSSTSDSSTSSPSSAASGSGMQKTATAVMHGSNWGFDANAYLVDPFDGRHYGIAEEILAQQLAYPVSHAPSDPDATEKFPAHYSHVFHPTTGPYTDTQQQAAFTSNLLPRTNRNLHSLAISTCGLNTQLSSSMATSPLPARRGSFDGDFSVFNAPKSAVVGGQFQAGSHLYTQSPHQRRHSVSSNPPLSASSASSTAGSTTNQSVVSGGTASAAGAKDPKKVSLYKTELCRSFEETGSCRYGNKCQFAHGQEELRKVERHPKHKSVMCKTFWEQGSCPYGQRCCFIHTAVPSDRGTHSIQSRAQFQSATPAGASHSLPAKPTAATSSATPTGNNSIISEKSNCSTKVVADISNGFNGNAAVVNKLPSRSTSINLLSPTRPEMSASSRRISRGVGNHKRQPSGTLASLYPVEDDAVINAINVTVDTSKLAKGSNAQTPSSVLFTTTSPAGGLPDKPNLGSTAVDSSSMQRRLRRASLGDAEDAGASGLVPSLNYKGKQSQCACSRIGGVGSCFSCSANSNVTANQARSYNHSRARTITSGEFAYQQQQQQHSTNRTARRSSLTDGGARRLPIFQSIQS